MSESLIFEVLSTTMRSKSGGGHNGRRNELRGKPGSMKSIGG